MTEFLEPLLLSPDDPAVARAAAGLRPELPASAPLPSAKVRFQPNDIKYKVSATGQGTLVYMYGVDEFGHSTMVRASGFYPYLYVELPSTTDARQLVNELNATVMLSLAVDKKKYGPERKAMLANVVGRARRLSATSAVVDPGKREPRCMPIVGYEMVPASIMRGTGGDYGYRGIEQRWLLKIYFYSPPLLVRARSLLHGKNAHLPPEAQAEALSRTLFKRDDAATAKIADARQQSILKWMKDPDAENERDRDVGEEHEGEADNAEEVAERAIYNNLPDNVDELFGRIDEAEGNADEEDDDAQYDLAANGDEWGGAPTEHVAPVDEAPVPTQMFQYGADAVKLLDAKLESEFVETARAYARAVRSSNSILSRLSEDRPLKVCDADVEFVLRFCVDCRISPCGWVEVDTRAAEITPDSHREPLRNGKLHSADSEHSGFPGAKWMLDRTPPGIEPSERFVRRVVERVNYRDRLDSESHQQIELWTDFHNVQPVSDEKLQATVAQGVRVSFDCEMETGPNNAFPKPEDQSVLNIGCTIPLPPRLGLKKKYRYVVFSVDQIATDVQRADAEEHVLCFPTETLMLLAFYRFIALLKPDEIVTFNGNMFDFPYLQTRSSVIGVKSEFENCWSKSKRNTDLRIVPRTFNSTAHGVHQTNEVIAEGVFMLDIYLFVKRNTGIRLKSLSLDGLSEHFLGDHKEKVSPAQINFLRETANGRRKLKRYVEKDALLPLRLDATQKWTLGLVEKARLTGCTLSMLVERGMGIQGKSLMYRWNRQRGLFIPEAARHIGVPDAGAYRLCVNYTRTDRDRALERGTYEGAIVLDPSIGLYIMCVSTLDFNSLYPSCQIAENMCCSTLVDPTYDYRRDRYLCYLVSTGAFTWDTLFRRIKQVTCEHPYAEVAPPNATTFLNHGVLDGLLPDIQRFNLGNRKEVKNLIEKLAAEVGEQKKLPPTAELAAAIADTQRAIEVYDQRQNGLKLVANSLYGLYGSDKSFLYAPLIAAAVTATGRCRILLAKYIAETVLATPPDDPAMRDMLNFPGVKSLLVNLPVGKDVVATMLEHISIIRKATTERPMNMRTAGETRTTTVTAARKSEELNKFFGAPFKRRAGVDRPRERVVDEASREAPEIDADARIKVVYGDTDSVFVRFWAGIDELTVAKFSAALADYISVYMHQRYGIATNVNACVYRIEFEKMATAFLLVGKKKYAMMKLVLKKGKLEGKNVPSLSGMEAGKRDTTKLVARGQEACIAILLDRRNTMAENMRRAVAYIHQEMVQPLLENRVDLFDLVQTKQLRNYIEAYTEAGKKAPVHVQLADKLCTRAGGRDKPDAPRPGDRLPYIIVKGDEALSARGENPVYAFQHGVQVDASYYLDKHVGPVLQRIFQPLLTAHRTDIVDDAERKLVTREYIFGSRTAFVAPKDIAGKKYDFTEYRDQKAFPTVHTVVRYPKRRQQRADDSFIAREVRPGVKCPGCKTFLADRRPGAVCAKCMETQRERFEPDLLSAFSQLSLDEKHLSHERAAIVRKCQQCADCEQQYTSIKCEEFDCPVLWRRYENMQALDECSRRKQDVIKSLNYQW